MAAVISELFSTAFTSVDDVEKRLASFENICLQTGDLRGVFATAYLVITRSVRSNLHSSVFRDDGWVQAYLVRFGNLYREAVLHSENGTANLVPKSWNTSFELARNKEGLIIQHLLLGINAHINHDLAIALYDVGIDPARADKYHDHTKINDILRDATESLKHDISIQYAPILKRLDRKTGYISNEAANFSIPKAREHAWSFAIALTRAATSAEQAILRKSLDEQAGVLARLILASPTRDARFTTSVSVLKWVDSLVTRLRMLIRKS